MQSKKGRRYHSPDPFFEDSFFNKFAEMARMSPILPLIGGGKTKFQPVYVEDIAEAVARASTARLPAARSMSLAGLRC